MILKKLFTDIKKENIIHLLINTIEKIKKYYQI